MRINMWMIKNMLEGADYEYRIDPSSPSILRSARFVYAPNCVTISQNGTDVKCRFGEDWILLKDIDLKCGFELIQGIFDYYNDWYATTLLNAQNNDWQRVVEDLGFLLKSPLVFFDDNTRVIAMNSPDYYVDDEWNYLKEHGYSSVAVMRTGRRNVMSAGEKEIIVQSERPVAQMRGGTLNAKLVKDNVTVGYLSAIEVNRKFNPGDEAVMRTAIDIIRSSYALFNREAQGQARGNCFMELIKNHQAEPDVLNVQCAYYDMKPDDSFFIYLIRPVNSGIENLEVLKRMLTLRCSACPIFIMDTDLAVLASIPGGQYKNVEAAIGEIGKFEGFLVCRSQRCQYLMDLWMYYDQAAYLLKLAEPGQTGWLYFRDRAVEYILERNDIKLKYAAIHDCIKDLVSTKDDHASELLHSLDTYLRFERSLSAAAEHLYVHKNTLLYRIRKIESTYEINLSDANEREYIMLSMKVLYIKTKHDARDADVVKRASV